jgi:hypothetical protein
LAKYIIDNNKTSVDEKMKELYVDVNQETINFIQISFNNLGKEKRINSTHSKAKKAVKLETLSI